ncbi:osmoprotectant ABC transporter substrate-binding protein [Peptostreptococcus equinus]|uniref:Osmoprotectant ABC transporter substrate-binding protein n=2 Tax=Peptostreptococcus equinus TaxID=3003601 RepID=A0ABY7JVF2_9FIRM|nr:osmoprotectant ABC transporter substrate-binding protein [Peptostreptococcus sp. CBA3647]
MQKQMIEHYYPKQKVSTINNLSSAMLIFQTMQGEYANVASIMYTGTSLTGELGMDPITDPELALNKVVKGYYDRFNLIWMPTYGFENTYAFMVKKEFAQKYNLKKVSDLKPIAKDLKAGVDTSWMEREGDGYRAFKNKYQFDFKSVLPMDVGLVYSAVNSGKMDVVLGYSTDGRINSYDLVVLEDDLRIFPPYDASPVISKKTMKEHPEIEEILLKLEGEVSSETMQKLNAESDGKKIEPKVVAERFLKEKNYFEEKKIKPLKDRPMYKDMLNNKSKK